MEGVLWYVLASSRGGPTRVRVVRALDERPRNANQLATDLDLDYTTVRHHLDVLMGNNVVRRTDDEYAAVYLFTEQAKSNWHVVEEILDTVDVEGGTDRKGGTDPGRGVDAEKETDAGKGADTDDA